MNEAVSQDESHIFIYRESGFIGSLTAWPIQLDSRKIGALKNGTFILIKTQPGKVKLLPENHLGVYSDEVEGHEFNAYGGKEYYLKHGPDSIYTSKMKFKRMDKETSSKELQKYNLVKVFDDRNTNRGVSIPNNIMAISKLSGRVFIERGLKTYPARVGWVLFPGDKVNTQDSSRASIYFNGTELLITELTSFQIPYPEDETKQNSPSKTWETVKDLIKGDDFELQTPTPSFGVRG